MKTVSLKQHQLGKSDILVSYYEDGVNVGFSFVTTYKEAYWKAFEWCREDEK